MEYYFKHELTASYVQHKWQRLHFTMVCGFEPWGVHIFLRFRIGPKIGFGSRWAHRSWA